MICRSFSPIDWWPLLLEVNPLLTCCLMVLYDLVLTVDCFRSPRTSRMVECDVEVKFSLFTLNSKEPEVPSVKPWWCRIMLKEQGTLQALEKRLVASVTRTVNRFWTILDNHTIFFSTAMTIECTCVTIFKWKCFQLPLKQNNSRYKSNQKRRFCWKIDDLMKKVRQNRRSCVPIERLKYVCDNYANAIALYESSPIACSMMVWDLI